MVLIDMLNCVSQAGSVWFHVSSHGEAGGQRRRRTQWRLSGGAVKSEIRDNRSIGSRC